MLVVGYNPSSDVVRDAVIRTFHADSALVQLDTAGVTKDSSLAGKSTSRCQCTMQNSSRRHAEGEKKAQTEVASLSLNPSLASLSSSVREALWPSSMEVLLLKESFVFTWPRRRPYLELSCILVCLCLFTLCFEVGVINCGGLRDLALYSSRYDQPVDRPKALGVVDKVYVVSLPRRHDRRQQVEQLSSALLFPFEYMDAVELGKDTVHSIFDHVLTQRSKMTRNETNFVWPADMDNLARLSSYLELEGSDLWNATDHLYRDDKWAGWNQSSYQPSSILSSRSDVEKYNSLTCSTEDHTIIPWEKGLPDHKLLTPSKLSCWSSHLSAVQAAANTLPGRPDGYELLVHNLTRNVSDQSYSSESSDTRTEITTLILEDDIDMERDVATIISSLWPSLPPSWDIVFLGWLSFLLDKECYLR
jgi:hypothetical protein